MKKAIVFVLAVGALTSTVFAQEVKITGKKCPLTVVTDRAAYENPEATAEGVESNAEAAEGSAEGAEAPKEVSKRVKFKNLDILGIVDDAYAVITYKKDQQGLVPLAEIQAALPDVDWASLNTVTDWNDLTHGSGGPNVQRLQENLTALSYMEGGIDGSYGSGTADAVYRYQTDHNLPATGDADIFTFFTIAEDVDGKPDPITVVYPTVVKVDTKFASIFKDVEDPAVLADYLDPEWVLSFDVYEGTGLIENTEEENLAEYTDESRPIDRIKITLRKVVRLVSDESGSVRVVPAIEVVSSGAYRPYVQEILVRNGSKVVPLATFDSFGGVSGIDVTEESYVELTDEAEELLKEEGTTLRVKGSSREYDM